MELALLVGYVFSPTSPSELVNHISSRGDMEEVYDRYSGLPEMREAIEKWETHLTYIFAAQTTEVLGIAESNGSQD
jgi:hypothetical protein